MPKNSLSRRNIGGVVAIIVAMLVGIIGVAINEITVFLSSDGEIYKYCGWDQIYCYNDQINSDTTSETYCTAVVSEIVYSDDCENCDSTCENSIDYDFDQEDYCKTQGSGDVWLACSIISILVLLLALLMVLSKMCADTETKCNGHYNIIPGIICVFGALFYILAVVVWFVDNPICWDSDQLDNREIDFGQSPYWLLAACVISMVGAALSVA